MTQDPQASKAVFDLIVASFPGAAAYPTWIGVGVLLAIASIALGVLPVARSYAVRELHRLLKRRELSWGEMVVETGLVRRLSWIIPLVVFYQGLHVVPALPLGALEIVARLTLAVLLFVVVHTLSAALRAGNAIYNTHPLARHRPINSYLQVVSIVAHLLTVVAIVAILLGKSPWLFLSGLGALMALLLLVFRDTLLSLVAGIQLTTNNLIRLGDWIEMPQFGADGDVVDISLHAIRVRNWDHTITVIPTHKFLDHAFKNWRGMSEMGARRIKRAFNVDLASIRFLSAEEVERFGRFVLLHDYIEAKKTEISAYNREHGGDGSLVANARRLTNIGTLRAYITAYLRQHPKVRQDMTVMVRQLEPTPKGLPIEIYVFSADIRWVDYEGIQADIFDHILAMVPEFGLNVYQEVSGNDARALFAEGNSQGQTGVSGRVRSLAG